MCEKCHESILSGFFFVAFFDLCFFFREKKLNRKKKKLTSDAGQSTNFVGDFKNFCSKKNRFFSPQKPIFCAGGPKKKRKKKIMRFNLRGLIFRGQKPKKKIPKKKNPKNRLQRNFVTTGGKRPAKRELCLFYSGKVRRLQMRPPRFCSAIFLMVV